jgi:hypothetical protein
VYSICTVAISFIDIIHTFSKSNLNLFMQIQYNIYKTFINIIFFILAHIAFLLTIDANSYVTYTLMSILIMNYLVLLFTCLMPCVCHLMEKTNKVAPINDSNSNSYSVDINSNIAQ